MLLKSDIEEAYKLQQSIQKNRTLIERTYLHKIRYKDPQIEVISGIRRSGKSTLMLQIMDKYKNPAFFNFEDPRVFGFDLADFQKLDEIMGTRVDAYFFDEVQNVDKCELFVRQLHNKNKKVFITGSNAAMLSKDLGTRLTGRHIRHELFPFSYEEYLIYQKFTDSSKSFDKYNIS